VTAVSMETVIWYHCKWEHLIWWLGVAPDWLSERGWQGLDLGTRMFCRSSDW